MKHTTANAVKNISIMVVGSILVLTASPIAMLIGGSFNAIAMYRIFRV